MGPVFIRLHIGNMKEAIRTRFQKERRTPQKLVVAYTGLSLLYDRLRSCTSIYLRQLQKKRAPGCKDMDSLVRDVAWGNWQHRFVLPAGWTIGFSNSSGSLHCPLVLQYFDGRPLQTSFFSKPENSVRQPKERSTKAAGN
jgi:hypothetical protein